ncbi:hypothetical protein [Kribbella speibonae]|uniref:Uncharacterized protein n=1 Tax=Kribbella speibonae TaxID=1572660 RepID=A0A4R0JI01_9ACTN|nr:hypothetical protein [Kribbella speibonae]TCC41395.1 hypothetical protein E0H92_06975 [Kribbella speibonae]
MKLHKFMPAVALLAAGLTVAPPAHAVPEQTTTVCNLVVPARISVNGEYYGEWARLGSGCPASVYTAVWKSSPAATPNAQGRLEFTKGSRMVQFGFFGSNPPLGTITWSPAGGATNINGVKVADLGTAYSVSRCASVAALSGGRKGSRTALLTTVSYWRPASNRYVRWANKQVLIQYQDIGTSTWKGLAYVTTSSVGQVTYNYYPNRTRRYRVYVPGTSSIWNIFSPVISR